MKKNKAGKSRIYSGVILASLLTLLGITASCGGGSVTVDTAATGAPAGGRGPFPNATPAQPTIFTIAAKDAAIVAMPYLASPANTRYLSDCQTGSAPGCVPGSDLYDGTSPTFISGSQGPWQTTTKGAAWLNSQTSGTYTLALVQGGAWNAAAQAFAINLAGNTYCPAGQTCSEIREYPAQGLGPKPVIYGPNLGTVATQLFLMGNGQRIMNLSLIGSGNGTTTSQSAFFLYCNNCSVHDDSILNVDIAGFDAGINDAVPENYNLTIEGNHFIENSSFGYIGGSQNLNLNYNYFRNNGSNAVQLHAIYVASHAYITGINVIGNYVTGYFTGAGATLCTGGPFILHGSITNLVVSGNTVIEPTNSADTCWGISANNLTAAPYGGFFRNALFSDNIVVNGGNSGLDVENCPNCVIENNLIIADNPSALTGIAAPPLAARTLITPCTPSSTVQCYDDPSTNYTVRNNTIYFTANANSGMTGITVGIAGSSELQVGHKVYNNTVTYLASGVGGYCFSYPLPLPAYATINNNNCFVPNSSYVWEKITGDSLSTWTKTGFDTNSSISNPGFNLSLYPYFSAWSDNSLAYQLFNNGTTNIFSPSSTLLGKGMAGPLFDITGAQRSLTAPSIGAYEH